jgi:hypothetical protein
MPWWGVISSAAAPVLLVTGWTVAAGLQPGHFNSVARSISALAAYGATDRWVMTLALVAVGISYSLTALALRPAAGPGRLLLLVGGLATLGVAANPLPATGTSIPHAAAAGVGFVAMASWPLLAWPRDEAGPPSPGILSPVVAAAAAVVLLFLFCWFAAELLSSGGLEGLAERVLTFAEASWPLVVVLYARSQWRPWQLATGYSSARGIGAVGGNRGRRRG